MSSFPQSSISPISDRYYITMTEHGDHQKRRAQVRGTTHGEANGVTMDQARRAKALALGIAIVMLAAACTSPTHRSADGGGATSPLPAQASAGSGPGFVADGPDADEYGAREGYPVKAIYRVRFFVGLFSHYDQIFEGRVISRAMMPAPLNRALPEPRVRYEYQGKAHTLDEYLARNPATGLLMLAATRSWSSAISTPGTSGTASPRSRWPRRSRPC
jgi:hypothetical protein